MLRLTKNLMACASVIALGLPIAHSQTLPGCRHAEYYSDSRAHCADLSSNDVIALGIIEVVSSDISGAQKVFLIDEAQGRIELLLTRGFIRALDESPMEAFEVEGSITDGQMTVKALRPIE